MFADVIANNDNQNNPREREALYKAGQLTFTSLGGDRYHVEDTGRVTQTGPPKQLVWMG